MVSLTLKYQDLFFLEHPSPSITLMLLLAHLLSSLVLNPAFYYQFLTICSMKLQTLIL